MQRNRSLIEEVPGKRENKRRVREGESWIEIEREREKRCVSKRAR